MDVSSSSFRNFFQLLSPSSKKRTITAIQLLSIHYHTHNLPLTTKNQLYINSFLMTTKYNLKSHVRLPFINNKHWVQLSNVTHKHSFLIYNIKIVTIYRSIPHQSPGLSLLLPFCACDTIEIFDLDVFIGDIFPTILVSYFILLLFII